MKRRRRVAARALGVAGRGRRRLRRDAPAGARRTHERGSHRARAARRPPDPRPQRSASCARRARPCSWRRRVGGALQIVTLKPSRDRGQGRGRRRRSSTRPSRSSTSSRRSSICSRSQQEIIKATSRTRRCRPREDEVALLQARFDGPPRRAGRRARNELVGAIDAQQNLLHARGGAPAARPARAGHRRRAPTSNRASARPCSTRSAEGAAADAAARARTSRACSIRAPVRRASSRSARTAAVRRRAASRA